MACFLVPAAEAVITTIAAKIVKTKEQGEQLKSNGSSHCNHIQHVNGIKLSTKLGWLNKMLWGGSALLAFEHVWHGEISPVFPFLTAVSNGETSGMLAEMSRNGVAMALLVTAVWAGVLAVTTIAEKKSYFESEFTEEGA